MIASIQPQRLEYLGPSALDPDYMAYSNGRLRVFLQRRGRDTVVETRSVVFTTSDGTLARRLGKQVQTIDDGLLYWLFRKNRIRQDCMLELTYGCNLRCAHCYLPSRTACRHEERSTILSRLAEAVDGLKCLKVLELVVTGGEIFLCKGIAGALDLLSQHFPISILTNGTLINDAAVDLVERIGVRNVGVSVYSVDPLIHDRVTRVEGSWRRALEGIDRLKARKLPLSINVPLLVTNAGTLSATTRWLAARGERFSVDPLVFPATADIARLVLPPAELAAMATTGVVSCEPGSLCTAGDGKLRVDPFGDVFACEYLSSPMGNLLRGDTDDESITTQTCAFREPLSDGRRIGVDTARRDDIHGCPARNFADTGRYEEVSPYLRELRRLLTPPGDLMRGVEGVSITRLH